MAKLTVILNQAEVEIDDNMVVDVQDFIPAGEYNPHNVRPFVLGDEFGVFAIVFASHEQEAIDKAIDSGKMDGMKVSDEDLENASEDELGEYICGGNASEYFYQDYLWIATLPNPAMSFITLLAAKINEEGGRNVC